MFQKYLVSILNIFSPTVTWKRTTGEMITVRKGANKVKCKRKIFYILLTTLSDILLSADKVEGAEIQLHKVIFNSGILIKFQIFDDNVVQRSLGVRWGLTCASPGTECPPQCPRRSSLMSIVRPIPRRFRRRAKLVLKGYGVSFGHGTSFLLTVNRDKDCCGVDSIHGYITSIVSCYVTFCTMTGC